jgi:alpha-glucosidase
VRFDAAGGLAKDPTYPELPEGWQPGDPSPYSDLDAVHDHYRRVARILAEYDGDRFGVAEVWGEPHVIEPYVRADELPQAFAIDPLFRQLDATLWRGLLAGQLDAVTRHGRLPAWMHGNHDVKRAVTRWGEDGARAVLLLMLALPGCLYLYAGDELGLPEVDLPDEAITDPTFRRSGGADRGRDGARVPLPWTSGPSPYGFAPDGTPTWLPQPDGWGEHAVERQECDPDSMLTLTRRAISVRGDLWRGAGDEVTWLDDVPTGCLGFRRGDSVCVARFGDGPDPDLSPYGEVQLAAGADGGSMAWWLR